MSQTSNISTTAAASITRDGALSLIAAARKAGKDIGIELAIAVTDAGGHLTAFERAEQKRTVPGASTLLREIAGTGASVHILSGSPEQLRARLEEAGVRVDVDERDETVSKRIRDAELEKIPRVVVYGDKESDDALAIREHGGRQRTVALSDFQAELATLLV